MTPFWKQLNSQIIQLKTTKPQEQNPHAAQNPTQPSAHREPTQLNQIRSKAKAAAAKNLDLPRQSYICSLFTMLANLLKNLYSTLSNQFLEGTTFPDLGVGGDKIISEVQEEIIPRTAITATNNHNKAKETNNNRNNTAEEKTQQDFLKKVEAAREEDVILGALVVGETGLFRIRLFC